mgnify:FL=1
MNNKPMNNPRKKPSTTFPHDRMVDVIVIGGAIKRRLESSTYKSWGYSVSDVQQIQRAHANK